MKGCINLRLLTLREPSSFRTKIYTEASKVLVNSLTREETERSRNLSPMRTCKPPKMLGSTWSFTSNYEKKHRISLKEIFTKDTLTVLSPAILATAFWMVSTWAFFKASAEIIVTLMEPRAACNNSERNKWQEKNHENAFCSNAVRYLGSLGWRWVTRSSDRWQTMWGTNCGWCGKTSTHLTSHQLFESSQLLGLLGFRGIVRS